jgi:hypothetical protein
MHKINAVVSFCLFYINATRCIIPNVAGNWIPFVLDTPESPRYAPDPETGYHEGIRDFLQNLHANAMLVPHIRPLFLSSIYFPIHCSLIVSSEGVQQGCGKYLRP